MASTHASLVTLSKLTKVRDISARPYGPSEIVLPPPGCITTCKTHSRYAREQSSLTSTCRRATCARSRRSLCHKKQKKAQPRRPRQCAPHTAPSRWHSDEKIICHPAHRRLLLRVLAQVKRSCGSGRDCPRRGD